MKVTARDAMATLLVAAIAIPYFGYLLNGSVPFIDDPRGMAATGLILGFVAFLIGGQIQSGQAFGRVEAALGLAALVIGIGTLALAETGAAEPMLAAFMTMVLLLWALQMVDHAGAVKRTAA